MDSIVPEDPKLAEKMDGYDRDSFLMRIRFQQAANDMMAAYRAGDLDRSYTLAASRTPAEPSARACVTAR